ncbi:MAG: transposase, partial [Desulfobacterales bacterium]|nr:transposase [Desulfobacterales bacterium]
MNLNVSTLPDNTSALKELVGSLVDSYTDLETKSQSRIDYLEERIRLLQNELFGRKTEKQQPPETDPLQLCLFAEPDLPEPEKVETITVPSHARKKRGRKPLPKDLPRVNVIHDIDES